MKALNPAKTVVPGSFQAWAAAIRPTSLLMAVGPVLLGASLGFARIGAVNGQVAALALAAAVLMQVITNLQNDVGFTERGGEKDGLRIGLPRATALGWLRVHEVHRVIRVLSMLATGVGLALVAYRGWLVLAIGVASLLAALAYMGGPKPIAYTPLGELTAFAFFGPVAVLGTDWLVTGAGFTLQAVNTLAATCAGSFTAAALALNNHRDQVHDLSVGRRTFAVLWGQGASSGLYFALLLGPFGIALFLAFWASPWFMLPWALFPVVMRLAKDFRRCLESVQHGASGVAYNPILMRTFKLSLWFSATLSVAALFAGRQAGV